MSEVSTIPNLPPALVQRICSAVHERIDYMKEPPLFTGSELEEELIVMVAEAFDAREAPLFAHLRNLSYNLGQVVNDGSPGAWEHHLESARRGVDHVLRLLEQHR